MVLSSFKLLNVRHEIYRMNNSCALTSLKLYGVSRDTVITDLGVGMKRMLWIITG